MLRRVISLIKTPRHLAKQYLHRRIDPGYRSAFVQGEEKARARALSASIEREGIVILPEYFRAPRLNQFSSAFERSMQGRINQYTPDSLFLDDIFAVEPVFLEAALDAFLLEIIAGYFRRKFGVALAAATRLSPTLAHRDGSYQWHHDARGKQVNLMVLLSDVNSKGQRMAYLRQSHRRYYGHYRGIVDTRFNEVDTMPGVRKRIVEVVGPAGTVALFDSNGLHAGNRNEVEVRDTLNINYASRRHFKKVSARRADVLALSAAKRDVLTFNPKLQLT